MCTYAEPGSSWEWDEEALREALKTAKVLYLTNPSAPTGACYRRSELERLSTILEDYPEVWWLLFAPELDPGRSPLTDTQTHVCGAAMHTRRCLC